MALSTIVAVEVHCHEDTRSTALMRALATETRDLVIGVDLVELEHRKLDLFALVLDLLWLGVSLLFALLSATGQIRCEEQSGLVFNSTFTQNVRVLERATCKDQVLRLTKRDLL